MSTNDKERAPMMPGDVEGVAEVSPGPEYDRGTLVVAALAYQGVPLDLAKFVSGETVEEIRDDVAELAEAWKKMHDDTPRPSVFKGPVEVARLRERRVQETPARSAAAMYGNQSIAVRAGEPEPPRFNPADYQ